MRLTHRVEAAHRYDVLPFFREGPRFEEVVREAGQDIVSVRAPDVPLPEQGPRHRAAAARAFVEQEAGARLRQRWNRRAGASDTEVASDHRLPWRGPSPNFPRR